MHFKKNYRCLANPVRKHCIKEEECCYCKKFGGPSITKDGVSVAKEIELEDTIENMGAQMVKEVAQRQPYTGDGTTTATVLTQYVVFWTQKRSREAIQWI